MDSRLLAIVAICASLGIAACGDDEDDQTSGDQGSIGVTTGPTTPEPAGGAQADEDGAAEGKNESKPEPEPTGTEVKLAGSQFGDILFDAGDQAIYLFDLESSDKSECYGDCAAAWPPVLTDGEPVAGKGIDVKLLGTTERDDGKTQVTYNGHPLYYYAHEAPGEVRCHNVSGFGGLWLVLTAEGDAAPA